MVDQIALLYEDINKNIQDLDIKRKSISIKLKDFKNELDDHKNSQKNNLNLINKKLMEIKKLWSGLCDNYSNTSKVYEAVTKQCNKFYQPKLLVFWFYFKLYWIREKINSQFEQTFSSSHLVVNHDDFELLKNLYLKLISINKNIMGCEKYENVKLFECLIQTEPIIQEAILQNLEKLIMYRLYKLDYPKNKETTDNHTYSKGSTSIDNELVWLIQKKIEITQNEATCDKVFHVLIKPFEDLFDIHFNGLFQTNDINRPELFLKQVYYWACEHESLFDSLQNNISVDYSIKTYFLQSMSNLIERKLATCLQTIENNDDKVNFLRIYYFDQILYYYKEFISQFPDFLRVDSFLKVYFENNCYNLQQYMNSLSNELGIKIKSSMKNDHNEIIYLKMQVLKKEYKCLPFFMYDCWNIMQILISNIQLLNTIENQSVLAEHLVNNIDNKIRITDILGGFLKKIIVDIIIKEMDQHVLKTTSNDNKLFVYAKKLNHFVLNHTNKTSCIDSKVHSIPSILSLTNTLYFLMEQLEHLTIQSWLIKFDSTVVIMDSIIETISKYIEKNLNILNDNIMNGAITLLIPYIKYDWKHFEIDELLVNQLQQPINDNFIHFLCFLKFSILDHSDILHSNFLKDVYIRIFFNIEDYILNELIWVNEFIYPSSKILSKDILQFLIPLVKSHISLLPENQILSKIFKKLNAVAHILGLPPNDNLFDVCELKLEDYCSDPIVSVLNKKDFLKTISCRIDIASRIIK